MVVLYASCFYLCGPTLGSPCLHANPLGHHVPSTKSNTSQVEADFNNFAFYMVRGRVLGFFLGGRGRGAFNRGKQTPIDDTQRLPGLLHRFMHHFVCMAILWWCMLFIVATHTGAHKITIMRVCRGKVLGTGLNIAIMVGCLLHVPLRMCRF